MQIRLDMETEESLESAGRRKATTGEEPMRIRIQAGFKRATCPRCGKNHSLDMLASDDPRCPKCGAEVRLTFTQG